MTRFNAFNCNTNHFSFSKHKVSNFFKGLWTGKTYSSHSSLDNLSSLPHTLNPALQISSSGPHSSLTCIPANFVGGDLTDRRTSFASMVTQSQESTLLSALRIPHDVSSPASILSPSPGIRKPFLSSQSPSLQRSTAFQFDSDSESRKISPASLRRASSCQALETTSLNQQVPTLEISGPATRQNSEEGSYVISNLYIENKYFGLRR